MCVPFFVWLEACGVCVSWLRACITELKNELRQSVYLLSLQIFSFHTPNDLTSRNDFKLDYMEENGS